MRVERSEVGTQRTLSSLCSSLTTAQSRSVQYVGVECSLQQNQGVRAWFVISLNSSPSCYEVMTLCVGRVRDFTRLYIYNFLNTTNPPLIYQVSRKCIYSPCYDSIVSLLLLFEYITYYVLF